MAKQISKKTKCTACLSGMKNIHDIASNYAEIVDLKFRGYLTHSDSYFYLLVKQIEIRL